jgi:pilus assembly protein Flp/PilA
MTRFQTLGSATRQTTRQFVADESGATAIEYAMIAAGVGATIAATVWTLGESVKTNLYDKIAGIFS